MKRIALSVLAGAGVIFLTIAAATMPRLFAQSADFVLDVTVTDKAGPVTNLNKEDLQIQDDGKRATITNVTSVVARGSTAPGDGREIVLILDDAGVPMAGTPALQQIATIFASAAGPGDNVSVIRFHNGTDDLTKNREVSLARIAAFSAGSVPYVNEETDIDMFKLMAKLATKLGEVAPNRRKAIICIGSPAVCNPLERDSTAPRDEYPSWVNVLAATARNNVLVYSAIPAPVNLMGAGVVQRTGGTFFAGLTNYTPAIERVYGDLSQYYMATYTVEASNKQIRNLTVRTTRKDTTVKARDRRGK